MQLYDHFGIHWNAIILFLVFNVINKKWNTLILIDDWFSTKLPNPRLAGRMWSEKPFGAARQGIFNQMLNNFELS